MSDYHVFTRRFDRVVDASRLPFSATTNRAWNAFIEHTVEKRIEWELLGLGYAAQVLSTISPERLKDTVVTLLVDHSGSMRGQRMQLAVAAVDVAQSFLSHLGVAVEILGFTTRSWRGGWSRKLWLLTGKPPRPGRLCDLLHLVYLTPDQRRAPTTGLKTLVHMLDTDILKENVDGEALLWAASRQTAYPHSHRAIVFVSDGAPVDDATLSANGLHYLMDHLRDAIGQLRETHALGQLQIEADWDTPLPVVEKAVTLEDLGDKILKVLSTVLIDAAPGPEPVAAADAAFPRHGGALAAAARRYSIPLPDWLDLSTGINPVPYPAAALAADDLVRLPDPEATAGLISAARRCYGVPAGVAVQPVPGTDIALRLLPLLFPRSRVAILSPTYSGHAEAWSAAGHATSAARDLDGARGAEIVVLANPNNPDGRRIAPEDLTAFVTANRPAALVVDEAFAEVTPGLSLVPAMEGAPIVVLRSFGKFFGLAGLRLGFVLGSPALAERLGEMLGDWPVSGPAIAIGRAALSDLAWQDTARLRLAADRTKLDSLLAAAGFDAITGTDLFRLVQTPTARRLHEALAVQGIWTRIFEEAPEQIRIGLPPPEAFARFESALARYRS